MNLRQVHAQYGANNRTNAKAGLGSNDGAKITATDAFGHSGQRATPPIGDEATLTLKGKKVYLPAVRNHFQYKSHDLNAKFIVLYRWQWWPFIICRCVTVYNMQMRDLYNIKMRDRL